VRVNPANAPDDRIIPHVFTVIGALVVGLYEKDEKWNGNHQILVQINLTRSTIDHSATSCFLIRFLPDIPFDFDYSFSF
jgi:hypothetical protein